MNIKLKHILLGVLFALILGTGLTNCYTVNTGEVAIISTNGKLDKVEGEGLHFKFPLIQSKVFLETRERSYIFGKTEEQDTTLEVSTKDMQSIKLEFSVQANISDPEKLYRAFGTKYENRFIRPRVKEIVQATIAKYTIEEFVSKRAEISKLIFEDLKDDFAQYGISVSNVSIVNHDFSDEYEKAIEGKKVAEQSVEKAKAEQAKLLVEQENKVKLAEYELKQKELQAKANSIESNSLTPQLLRKMAIEKWDGKLPQVQGNNGSTLIKLDE
ncbi:prohibitin family protein [Fusobacterium periodonticum]|uniref:SPFH/Band 7/PHB domain protein n=1 Tax=Fusobacterium periodonticum ATCC 33693 TaxID=546275 RepID=D4CXJ1_9FUSO|nr:prohibitin family protein [Fusobacterium periodonticum]EFE86111.1 SPFH/Band 7/PHB domain protein [Fusobacterium periodonticum ATCC 33693]